MNNPIVRIEMENGDVIRCELYPDKAPIITTAELQRDLPGFVWDSGHSGQILEPKLADMLEDKWHKYIDENEAMFEDPEKAVRPRRGKAFLQIITHPVSPRRDRR